MFRGPLGSIADWAIERSHTVARHPVCGAHHTFDALVVMGGPMSVHDEGEFPWLAREKDFLRRALEAGKKVLGVCLGAQLLAEILGGKVERLPEPEIGWFPIRWTEEAQRTLGMPESSQVFHWHGEGFDVPPGGVRLASSPACPNQAFLYRDLALALQFHLEVTPEIVRGLYRRHSVFPRGRYVQYQETEKSDSHRFREARHQLYLLLDHFFAQPERSRSRTLRLRRT